MSKPSSNPGNRPSSSGKLSLRDRLRQGIEHWRTHPLRPSLVTLGHVFVAGFAVWAALHTAHDSQLSQSLEQQLQTLFFQIRGPLPPPDDIVILTIDENSIDQGKIYLNEPKRYPYLEPLQSWPWKRSAYAIAVDRLMQAGARSVAIDVVFDRPNANSPETDQQFQKILRTYAGRITLAAQYDSTETPQGPVTQLVFPAAIFETSPLSVGLINYRKENDRFYRFDTHAELKEKFDFPQFPVAALQAAQMPVSQPDGDYIFFYGPKGTFPSIPFWHVIDPQNWAFHQQQETFKDKIVLIGPTAKLFQDSHGAPFAGTIFYPDQMPGIEVHANAIATLMQRRNIRPAISSFDLQGWLVLIGILTAAYIQTRSKRPLRRFWLAVGVLLGWGGVAYVAFTYGTVLLPAAMPMIAIALSGSTYLFTGIISEKLRLRRAFQPYTSSPIVQEIVKQDEQLRDLLQRRVQDILNRKLAGRYRVVRILGSGGFGKTYIAEDHLRPGTPLCVVKQLSPSSNNPRLLQYARELFAREAVALEMLGLHPQIPQLLAHFEEDQEFYLVQEFIDGTALSQQLTLGRALPEAKVIVILRQLMEILQFVHSHKVIHRDIKPSNIICRHSDNKYVLIDFGAVKEITQIGEEAAQSGFTVGIGTQGYMPNEQSAGKPQWNSDIYAAGMIGIQALTGIPPSQLKEDPRSGEVLWQYHAQVSQALAEILSKMVRYDFRQRYQSAKEALDALDLLSTDATSRSGIPDVVTEASSEEEPDTTLAGSTRLWADTGDSNPAWAKTDFVPPDLAGSDSSTEPKTAAASNLNNTQQQPVDMPTAIAPPTGNPEPQVDDTPTAIAPPTGNPELPELQEGMPTAIDPLTVKTESQAADTSTAIDPPMDKPA